MTLFSIRDDQVRANCLQHIKSLEPWKLYDVEIKEPKKSRNQEKYVHMLWGILAKETGEDAQDLKDRVLLATFGPRELVVNEKTYLLPVRSSELTKERYTRLIDATLMIFDQLNLQAPMPGYYGLAA
jgi:hypothetical protein